MISYILNRISAASGIASLILKVIAVSIIFGLVLVELTVKYNC